MHSDDETPTDNHTPSEQRELVPLRREVPSSDRQRSTILAGVLSLAGVALGFGLGQVATANSNCAQSHRTVVHRQPIAQASPHVPNAPQARLTWLGVHAQSYEGENNGALITRVVPGSPAALAGLEEGQRIVELAESPVFGAASLAAEVRRRGIGEAVTVRTYGAGGEQTSRPMVLDGISPRALNRHGLD